MEVHQSDVKQTFQDKRHLKNNIIPYIARSILLFKKHTKRLTDSMVHVTKYHKDSQPGMIPSDDL